ncbi:hypothetical protein [Pararhodobacter oceanensis]|uniref:Uncharacterized protein n=1 Tax=Pararhodobacter oceanensis TaxID=2172121 RepID=A0A2T8HT63_9RHOB|nr:hypothetical protein [Pararhodobacter oceanensis]PVH28639.1 hypothetical protein DDE20_10600 [Pararhodobacter oceanensis]
MNVINARAVCETCNETLPRAAAGRCPVCRTPISSAMGRAMGFAMGASSPGVALFCRRCKTEIPRAANASVDGTRCPTCAMPAQRRQPLSA